MKTHSIFLYCLFHNIFASPAIDKEYVESFLDPKLCKEHLDLLRQGNEHAFRDTSAYITPNTLRLSDKFSLGSYSQCLAIKKSIADHVIEGKYCTVEAVVPKSIIRCESMTNIEFMDNRTIEKVSNNKKRLDQFCKAENLRFIDERYFVKIYLGVCIPKSCSAKETANVILSNFGRNDEWENILEPNVERDLIKYTVTSCRLPGDKPIATADYMAIVLLSLILVLVVASTVYDLKIKDSKDYGSLLRTFSVYSNTNKFFQANSSRNSIECVDGIRVISMLWIILLHCYTRLLGSTVYGSSFFESSLITSGVLGVDTFFLLSGLFMVYSNINRFNTNIYFGKLKKFYLNRLMRLLPMLLTVTLLQASILNHISDGPLWSSVMAKSVEACRNNWFISVLLLQNLVQMCEPNASRCIRSAWYLDVDTQLYFLSPIVLYWLIKSRKTAVKALTTSILLSLATTLILSYYLNFIFDGAVFVSTFPYTRHYLNMFYENPLSRGAPFFIGMLCGYLLHLYRVEQAKLNTKTKCIGWVVSLIVVISSICLRGQNLYIKLNSDTLNCILNTFWRSFWAAAVGWIIFACHHGYGGFINWFLSLQLWKLPSKLSCGIFLIHRPIYIAIQASQSGAITYTITSQFYVFLTVTILSTFITFILTVTIETPILNLYNIIMAPRGSEQKTSKAQITE